MKKAEVGEKIGSFTDGYEANIMRFFSGDYGSLYEDILLLTGGGSSIIGDIYGPPMCCN